MSYFQVALLQTKAVVAAPWEGGDTLPKDNYKPSCLGLMEATL